MQLTLHTTDHWRVRWRLNPHLPAERQPYARSVLCPTSMIYPSGSRM
jgi:hypothetical protein